MLIPYLELSYNLNREFGQENGLYKYAPLYNFLDNHDVNRVVSEIRKNSKALIYGNYIEEKVSDRQFVFSRNFQEEKIVVVCNSDSKTATIDLSFASSEIYEDLLSHEIFSCEELKKFNIGPRDIRFLRKK